MLVEDLARGASDGKQTDIVLLDFTKTQIGGVGVPVEHGVQSFEVLDGAGDRIQPINTSYVIHEQVLEIVTSARG